MSLFRNKKNHPALLERRTPSNTPGVPRYHVPGGSKAFHVERPAGQWHSLLCCEHQGDINRENLAKRYDETMVDRFEKALQFLGNMSNEIKDISHDDSVWAFQVQTQGISKTGKRSGPPKDLGWWKVRKFDDLYWFQQLSHATTVEKGLFGRVAPQPRGGRQAQEQIPCRFHANYLLRIRIHVMQRGTTTHAGEESTKSNELPGNGDLDEEESQIGDNKSTNMQPMKPPEVSSKRRKRTNQETEIGQSLAESDDSSAETSHRSKRSHPGEGKIESALGSFLDLRAI